jgi:hypothetical protein
MHWKARRYPNCLHSVGEPLRRLVAEVTERLPTAAVVHAEADLVAGEEEEEETVWEPVSWRDPQTGATWP